MNKHNSQRGHFAYELYHHMKTDKDIWIVALDLGYKVWDQHFQDFSDRCINPGAAEQAGLDIAVGLALSGKKPFVYSITPFLLYRPFETLRTYINHEQIPVRLVASGRDDDYKHDGFSHYAGDDVKVLACLPEIDTLYPQTLEEIPGMVREMVEVERPWYINLRR